MNKVYNTVWNESTGMWVVTSELTRKGGRRPRQISHTVLAGLIAGLLMPSRPVLATDYNNKTLGSGGTSTIMSLSSGDTATNTDITYGGLQIVSSGGSASSTTMNGGGLQYVSSGGSATGTTINGGEQAVFSGGSATGTTINGGEQAVFSGGSATGTTINGGEQHVFSGGSATNTTINSGGHLIVSSGGSATDITQNSGGAIRTDTGATVSGTSVSGCCFSIANGSASNMLLENGGSLTVLSGNKATNTTLNDGGWLTVSGGGSATSTTLNDRGFLKVFGGGSVTSTTMNAGGTQYISGSATSTTMNGGWQYVFSGGSVTNTIMNGGNQYVSGGGSATGTTINGDGSQMVYSGGSATSTTINSSQGQTVYSGGSATSTTISAGGLQYIFGSATSTTINSGGEQIVDSGGNATDITINSGGLLYVYGSATDITQNSGGAIRATTDATVSGTSVSGSFSIANGSASNMLLENGGLLAVLGGNQATNTTINSGGLQYVLSGGSATSDTINGGLQYVLSGGSATSDTINGGAQYVSGGGSATGTTINSGHQEVFSGGSAISTTMNGGEQYVSGGGSTISTTMNGGEQYIASGGSATGTTINGGAQYVSGGGSATNTTINSGGHLIVSSGGRATDITQNSGGAIRTDTGATVSGTSVSGSFSIANGRASNMLLENGGSLTVLGGHQASDTTVVSGGTLRVNSGGVLSGTTTLLDNSTLGGDVVQNEGNLYYLNNNAADFTGNLTGSGRLTQEGGSSRFSGLLSQGGGIVLLSGAVMTMDALQAKANVTTRAGTTLTLDNGTNLTGSIAGDTVGAGDVAVKGNAVWHLDGDSTVGALTLDNGTIDFRPPVTTRLSPVFRAVSLALDTLSGNGLFRMNTDIASHTGDMLKVTGNATGSFVLDIKNTGQEPVSAGAPLKVVQTGGGDATFTLSGGKVDAGTWEYYLNKEKTDWYLKPDVRQPDTDNPGTDNHGSATPSTPVRQITKSADAVLGMATVPVYVFNNELENLRFRHGDFMQNTRSPGGVWGRYTGSDNRISGGASQGYSLTQNGFETGGDKVFDQGESRLAVGAFVSYTDNSISHNRGGSSTVGSTGGGLYATWFDNNGYYLDGVLKYNRFSNELHTWMSDGTAVKGDYRQNGFGGSLEAGRTFSLDENIWVQPYARTTMFRADAKDISLNNGMKARIGVTKSVQAEAGVNLGMNLEIGGKTVSPYLKAAVSHEFSDSNRVRLNNSYNFDNDISGTTGKYGAGVSAQLTANAGVWAEASYQKGEQTESPVTGSVGFRISF